jgi:hypothetical protein
MARLNGSQILGAVTSASSLIFYVFTVIFQSTGYLDEAISGKTDSYTLKGILALGFFLLALVLTWFSSVINFSFWKYPVFLTTTLVGSALAAKATQYSKITKLEFVLPAILLLLFSLGLRMMNNQKVQ